MRATGCRRTTIMALLAAAIGVLAVTASGTMAAEDAGKL